ncbi:MAG TPA: hypothetical protein VL992_01660 [Tepidisphaeraceae bacterium]|nr:hypothetical protein [Tepidisphaeraceae bacterium]
MISISPADTPMTPQTWALVALAMGVTIYGVFLRPKMKQKKDPLSRPLGLSRQRDVEKQMETLLVELSEMARQITAQLDTRAAKLDALIREADEKIAELKAISAGSAPRGPSLAGRDIQVPPAPPADRRHAAIYELADAGLSPGQIAQRLQQPNGEVELILALRSRQ